MAKKEKKEKKPFSWWGLIRRVAIVAGAVFIAASLLNFVGLSIGLSTLATTYVANAALAVSAIGLGGLGLSASASLVTGAVNLFRVIFSKKYRDQLKAKRLAKKKEKEQNKQNNKNKEKEETLEQVETLTNDNEQEDKRTDNLESLLDEVPSLVPQDNKDQTVVLQDPAPINDETKVKASNRAAGLYDKMSQEGKEFYDSIMKKNTPAYLFGELSRVEAIVLKEEYDKAVKQYKVLAKDRELNAEESKDAAKVAALKSKLTSYIRRKDANEKSTVDEEKIRTVMVDVEDNKINKDTKKTGKR